MASQNYNPGEPVFDQSTGEPFIDEDGNLVEVAPGLKVTNGADTLFGNRPTPIHHALIATAVFSQPAAATVPTKSRTKS